MTHRPTVLVIGGGATGAGIVRDLTLRGVDATLVDPFDARSPADEDVLTQPDHTNQGDDTARSSQ